MAGDESNYEIGYGRPPRHSQFRKGVASNPAGRPKGTRNFKTDFLAEMGETISVTEGGMQRRLSKQQITLKALIAKAMRGDLRAAAKVVELAVRYCPPDQADQSRQDLSQADQEILATYLKQYSEHK